MERPSRASHLVVTVHGIRTFGQWQDRLEALLRGEDAGVRVESYRYGYFSCVAFMLPPLRWIVTRRFRNALLRTCGDEAWDRIDLVGHSFGTHLVGWGLHGIPRAIRPRVHTVVLAGSVLKPTFPWRDLIGDCVGRVVNDCGTHDLVLVLNQAVVLFTGMAGRVGFAGMSDERFRNRFFPLGHSGYFLAAGKPSDDFMRTWWLPLLAADAPIAVPADPRSASALQGIETFVLNNAEPVKLAVYLAPFVFLALLFFGLYRKAEHERGIAASRLTELEVATGQRAEDAGDLATALLWFVEAARNGDAASEHDQRVRFATARQREPGLAQVLFLDAWSPRIARFDPKGARIAVAGGTVPDEGARVFDVATGRSTPLLAHANTVGSIAFAPDGETVATGSDDFTARIWNARTGAPVSPPLSQGSRVRLLRFSPDGSLLLAAGDGLADRDHPGAILWRAEASGERAAVLASDAPIVDAAFRPDGLRVAMIDAQGRARIWDPRTGTAVGGVFASDDPEGPGRSPCVRYAADGRRVVTSNGRTIEIWDADAGVPVGGPWTVRACARVEMLERDAVLAVDRRGATELFAEEHSGPFRHGDDTTAAIAVSRSKGELPRIATASLDGSVRVWDPLSESLTFPVLRHTGAVIDADLSEDGNRLLTVDVAGIVRVWDLSDALRGDAAADPAGVEVRCTAFAPDGARVATGARDGTVRIADTATGAPSGPSIVHPGGVTAIAFDRDGSRIATGGEDGSVRVWSAKDGAALGPTIEHAGPIVAVGFSSDGSSVLAAGGTSARLFDARSGECRTAGEPQDEEGVDSAALSPDGSRIATGGMDGVARVWDARTGEPVTPPLVHTGGSKYANLSQRVSCVAFSPDGRLLATSSGDGATHVWDAATGSPAAPSLIGGDLAAAFGPDGRWIATAGSSGAVRVFDARTGIAITPPLDHSNALTLAFDSSGTRLRIAGMDGSPDVLDLLPETRSLPELRTLAEVLAARRIDAAGGIVDLTVEELRSRWEALRSGSAR